MIKKSLALFVLLITAYLVSTNYDKSSLSKESLDSKVSKTQLIQQMTNLELKLRRINEIKQLSLLKKKPLEEYSYVREAKKISQFLNSKNYTERKAAKKQIENVFLNESDSNVVLAYLNEAIYNLNSSSLSALCENKGLKTLEPLSFIINKVKRVDIKSYCSTEVSG